MTIGLQMSALRKVEAAIASGKARIAAVDPDLRPEARQARIAAIRAEVAAGLEAVAGEMRNRRKAAEEGLGVWSQAAVRRRAKFSDDDPTADAMQKLAFFETVKRTPTGELVTHLKDAVSARSLARAEALRLEFQGRPDAEKFTRAFGAIFDQAVDPKAQALEKEFGEIIGVADLGDVLVREFVNDRSLPTDRLNAARAAGMVPVTQLADADRAAALAS